MPLPDNTKMSTGDLPSCLCKRGSKCHKFSPPNIGTGILQDKSVEALWNVDSLVRRHMEGNPHRTFVMRLLMKPTVVVGKNSLVKTLLTEKNDCTYNMLKDFFHGLFGDAIMFAEHDVPAEYRDPIQSKHFSLNTSLSFGLRFHSLRKFRTSSIV